MEAQELKNIKDILIQKRSLLVERLEKIESSKVRKEPLNADSSEQAQEVVNHEVVDALDDLEGVELAMIDQALARIENGSYGQCLDCGEMISPSRIKAIPYASFCINCAKDS
jgi:RNA polymerase-binding transcription factor DksA